MNTYEESKKVLRENIRQLTEQRRYCRRLWHYFQMGELRAKTGLPPAPGEGWTAAQEAAYCRGYHMVKPR